MNLYSYRPNLYRAAKMMIDAHGSGAQQLAERHARELLDEAVDLDGAQLWLSLALAIDELARPRRPGELLH